MKRHHLCRASLVISALFCASAYAEKIPVIAGVVQSETRIAEAQASPLEQNPTIEQSPLAAQSELSAPITVEIEKGLLPVRTDALTAAEFESYAMPQDKLAVTQATLHTPVCVIGDDALSRAWLVARNSTLKDIHAVCLIVNIEKAASLAELRALAPDVQMVPFSGQWLAQYYNLKHYPALVTAQWVAQ